MYDVAVEVLRDMGRNIRGDDVADQLAGPRISPLAGEECAPEEKGVFVFCYMSGKDIAQSSGESGAWYWCIAQGERRVQCGHLVDTARTQGQGGGISCMVGSGRCTCTLSIRYRLILGGMDTFVFAKRCTGRTRGTFQPLCPPILREG